MPEAHLTDVSFTNLNLPESLARGIADAGFERCTPIQAQTLACARWPDSTWPGKRRRHRQDGGRSRRAVLADPCAARSRRPQGQCPLALIIAPTRELAVQIHHDAEILGQYTGLKLGLAFGGVDYRRSAATRGGCRHLIARRAA